MGIPNDDCRPATGFSLLKKMDLMYSVHVTESIDAYR